MSGYHYKYCEVRAFPCDLYGPLGSLCDTCLEFMTSSTGKAVKGGSLETQLPEKTRKSKEKLGIDT